jgi:hypothetical protein
MWGSLVVLHWYMVISNQVHFHYFKCWSSKNLGFVYFLGRVTLHTSNLARFFGASFFREIQRDEKGAMEEVSGRKKRPTAWPTMSSVPWVPPSALDPIHLGFHAIWWFLLPKTICKYDIHIGVTRRCPQIEKYTKQRSHVKIGPGFSSASINTITTSTIIKKEVVHLCTMGLWN